MDIIETLIYLTNNTYLHFIKFCFISMGVMQTINIVDYEGCQAEVITKIYNDICINERSCLEVTNIDINGSIAIVKCY